MFRALAGVALLCAVATSAHTSDRRAANVTTGCVDRFDPMADYFPDKLAIEDALDFSVEYRRSYKVVTVRDATEGGLPERYVLAQCGTPAPPLTGGLAGAQLVTVPLSSFFAFSTTHLPLLADLDRMDVLTGVAQHDAVMDPKAKARIKAGHVVEFARVGLVIDVERVVAAKPSLLMATGTSNATLSVIRQAGVPVVANSEWREPTALGRAEWLKYMALFLNEERKAQAVYGDMKHRYRGLSARATTRSVAERPLVMTGRSTRGLFTIAGGRSYVAALIKDAGGRYVWADNPSVGFASVDLEAQIHRAADADVWINGGGWKNLAAMAEDEPRYAAFKAFRQGQVWVYERRQTPTGANDYWSRSVTRPDLVLADLVKIFHPALTPERAFEWYMRVPAR
ncbi:MAG: ABC transporter substrate-binding protein [Acidobacteria bacterium]|nr:MAG: ABC transporter substrate-binding protein [Acidobacteriota bacterium]